MFLCIPTSTQLHPNQPDLATAEDPRLTAYLFNTLEAGDKVVQSIGGQADLRAQLTPEGQTPHPIVDVAEQFERASRAMRRTVLLIRHIAQSRTNPARQRNETRKRIICEVEEVIQHGKNDAEPLQAEFRERLDAPDLEDEIANRPIADIIKDIRRDLEPNPIEVDRLGL